MRPRRRAIFFGHPHPIGCRHDFVRIDFIDISPSSDGLGDTGAGVS